MLLASAVLFVWRLLCLLRRSVGEGTGGKTSAPRLPHFPEFGLLSVQKLLQLFPSLSPAPGIQRMKAVHIGRDPSGKLVHITLGLYGFLVDIQYTGTLDKATRAE